MRITRDELAHQMADQLTAAMDIDDLAQFFFDHHYDYYRKDADDQKLREDAVALRVVEESEELTFIEDDEA